MAIGGVRGKAAGIVHITITQVGATMVEPRVFIRKYRQVGEIITGIVAGTDSNGTISESLRASFSGTGEPGKSNSIGRSIIPGVFKGRNISHNHRIGIKRINQDTIHSRNTRERHNILTLVMETLETVADITVAEIKGTKGSMSTSPSLYEKAAIIICIG
jgi:hypothetical protein